LDEMLLVWTILFREPARPPRYVENNSLILAMLSDPDGTYLFLPFRISIIACYRGDGISFHFILSNEAQSLYAFALRLVWFLAYA
jgi:hypothetical protein